MKKPWNCITSLLLILVCSLVVSCSKQATEKLDPSDNKLLSDPLLLKLPESTAGFAVFDLEGEGYKRLQKSPYGGKVNAREALAQVKGTLREMGDEALVELAQRLFDAVDKLGMINADGTYSPEKVVRSTVVFAGTSSIPELPLELGLFARAATGVDLSKQLTTIQSSLKDSGAVVTSVSIKDGEAFSVTIKNSPAKLVFGANRSLFGVSTSSQAIELLLSNTASSTLATLKGLPEYKRSAALLVNADKPVAFGFASLNRSESFFEQVAKNQGNLSFTIKNLPVEAVAMASGFPEGYVQSIGLAVTPRSESQTRLVNALENSSLPATSTGLPSDTALALTLDPRFLLALDSFVQGIKSVNTPEVEQQLRHTRVVTIGVRNSSGGAPVPDVMLAVDSSSRDTLRSNLESSLASLLSFTGQAAPWQTKEIAGNQTRFFSTLIGAGVYTVAPKGSETLMVGTSESAIRDLASSQGTSPSGYMQSLSSSMRAQVSSANLARVYLNFSRIAEVLDSVKSTLAMFTGGNTELNELLNSARIRSWGVAAGSVSYTPGTLVINTGMSAPAT